MNNSIQSIFDTNKKAINRLSPKVYKNFYEEFFKKLDIELQKKGSNAMTKTIRKLMQADKISCGINASVLKSVSPVPVYGVYINNGETIINIIVDIVKCSPDSAELIIESIEKMIKMGKEITQSQRILNDANIERVAELKDEIEKESKVLAGLVDYGRVAEAIYFIFLRFLVTEIDKGASGAMFQVATDLYRKLILKVFGQYMDLSDDNIKQVFNAIVDYVFAASFTQLPHTQLIRNLRAIYPQETVEILENINIKKIDSLDKIVDAFNLAKIIRMPRMTWNNQLAKVLSETGLMFLYSTYDYYIAWMVFSLHNPVLFRPVIIDKDLQAKLETIVLNYKSRARI